MSWFVSQKRTFLFLFLLLKTLQKMDLEVHEIDPKKFVSALR